MINDAMGVASVLPILGQERLLFTFRTPGSFPIDFDTYNAVIYNVDKRFQVIEYAWEKLNEHYSFKVIKKQLTDLYEAVK